MAANSLVKLEHKNDLMQKRAQKAALTMEANAEDIIRKGAGVAAAGLLGYAKKKGKLQTLWSPMDMPKTLFVSAVATTAALFLPKKGIGRFFRTAFNGVGESTMAIGTFEYASGATISGDDGTVSGAGGGGGGERDEDIEGRRSRERNRAKASRGLEQRMKAELEAMRRERDGGGDDDEYYVDSEAA